ncbi:uncharacterized protein LOC120334610 [Styela clava]
MIVNSIKVQFSESNTKKFADSLQNIFLCSKSSMEAFSVVVFAACLVLGSAISFRFTPNIPACDATYPNYENPEYCAGPNHICRLRECLFNITKAVVSSDPPKLVSLSKPLKRVVKECKQPGRSCSERDKCSCQHEFDWAIIKGTITVYPGRGNNLKRPKSLERKLLARVPSGCRCGIDKDRGRCQS